MKGVMKNVVCTVGSDGKSRIVASLSFRAAAMVLSHVQAAKRAYVKVLRALSVKYDVASTLTREDSEQSLTAQFRKLARRVHPDKGGSLQDTKVLFTARDEWNAAKATAGMNGRPKAPSPTSHTSCDMAPNAVAIDHTCERRGKGYRIQSEGVNLTYMNVVDHAQWHRLVEFVKSNLRIWRVPKWCASLEKCTSSFRLHVHVYLQFAAKVDRTLHAFMFEGIRPNASTLDHCGEGICRKRLQESINRGFFYVWADKIGTEREPSGKPCVQGNHMPCWTNSLSKYDAILKNKAWLISYYIVTATF